MSGTLKSYYYGILLEDLAEVAITGLKTHRVITVTFSGINLNDMSGTEKTALKDLIKSKIVASTDLVESDIIGIELKSGSVKVNIYLKSTITETQAEEAKNAINFTIEFNVAGSSKIIYCNKFNYINIFCNSRCSTK